MICSAMLRSPVEAVSPVVSASVYGGDKYTEFVTSRAALGVASPSSSKEEALEAFNAIAREQGCIAVLTCMGSSALPYRHLLSVISSFAWGGFDHIREYRHWTLHCIGRCCRGYQRHKCQLLGSGCSERPDSGAAAPKLWRMVCWPETQLQSLSSSF